ncbi:MAG: hypothetical protein WC881_09910, partial [Elusimicrobiota bacterium]
SGARWNVRDDSDGAHFEIAALRLWPIAIFLGFWLWGWTAGEISAAKSLLGMKEPGPAAAFLLFWLAGWTVGGIFAWAAFFWCLAGQEIVTLGNGRLSIRWRALFLHWTREFDAAQIQDLRVQEAKAQDPRRSAPIALSLISFRHARGRMLFGIGLKPDDAAALLAAIRSRGGLPDCAFAPKTPAAPAGL